MRRGWRRVAERLRTLLLAAAAGGAVQVPHASQAAISPQEQAAWDRARGSGNADAFQRYLELYPTGVYAEQAFRILIEKSWRAPKRKAPPIAPGEKRPELNAAQGTITAQSLY
jgi:hypothetical protein